MVIDIFDYIHRLPASDKWKYIIIHHSLTKDGKVVDWEAIRRYHVDILRFDDIGYNFGLEYIDTRLDYRVGGSLDRDGAHTYGMNDLAIGICILGNWDLIEPSHQHYFMTASLCRCLMDKFKIPTSKVLPHWAYSNKTCPGRKFDILKLRENYIKCV